MIDKRTKINYQKNKAKRKLQRPGQKHEKVWARANYARDQIKLVENSLRIYHLKKQKKLRELGIDNPAQSKEVELQPRHEQHFDSSLLCKKEPSQDECKSEVKQEEC
jgi:hypothetical protein